MRRKPVIYTNIKTFDIIFAYAINCLHSLTITFNSFAKFLTHCEHICLQLSNNLGCRSVSLYS